MGVLNEIANLNLASLVNADRNALVLLIANWQMEAERELSARRFKGQMSAMKRKIYSLPR